MWLHAAIVNLDNDDDGTPLKSKCDSITLSKWFILSLGRKSKRCRVRWMKCLNWFKSNGTMLALTMKIFWQAQTANGAGRDGDFFSRQYNFVLSLPTSCFRQGIPSFHFQHKFSCAYITRVTFYLLFSLFLSLQGASSAENVTDKRHHSHHHNKTSRCTSLKNCKYESNLRSQAAEGNAWSSHFWVFLTLFASYRRRQIEKKISFVMHTRIFMWHIKNWQNAFEKRIFVLHFPRSSARKVLSDNFIIAVIDRHICELIHSASSSEQKRAI